MRLKMGMVGGGLDATVGSWHRRAAAIDGGIEQNPPCPPLTKGGVESEGR